MIIYNKYDQLGAVESRYEMSHPAAQLGCTHCLAGDSADTSDVTAIGIGFVLSLGVFAAIVAIAAKNPRIS